MDLSAITAMIQQKFPDTVTEQASGHITIKKESVFAVFDLLKNGPFAFTSLQCLTAVDRVETLEIIYHLYSFQERFLLTVKVLVPSVDGAVYSLTSLWDAANWFEREVFDLFGIKFSEHPDLRRILNPVDWTGHPLRKDYTCAEMIRRPSK